MDPFGPGCDAVALSVGADQAVDNAANADGFLVGAILNPGTAASTLTIKKNNGGSNLAVLVGVANGSSVVWQPNWAPSYSGAAPALSYTLAGTGATGFLYYKKRH